VAEELLSKETISQHDIVRLIGQRPYGPVVTHTRGGGEGGGRGGGTEEPRGGCRCKEGTHTVAIV
jgi:hypothetical protein